VVNKVTVVTFLTESSRRGGEIKGKLLVLLDDWWWWWSHKNVVEFFGNSFLSFTFYKG